LYQQLSITGIYIVKILKWSKHHFSILSVGWCSLYCFSHSISSRTSSALQSRRILRQTPRIRLEGSAQFLDDLKEFVFICISQIVSLAVSCGLSLSQNPPRIIPSRPQNTLIVNPLASLKPITKSIGAVIWSGFGGIAKYAIIMIAT
jgi:hypothetical protein